MTLPNKKISPPGSFLLVREVLKCKTTFYIILTARRFLLRRALLSGSPAEPKPSLLTCLICSTLCFPGLGRSPGKGKDYPLQYSGLENSMDYSPRGSKESDTTERFSLHLCQALGVAFYMH